MLDAGHRIEASATSRRSLSTTPVLIAIHESAWSARIAGALSELEARVVRLRSAEGLACLDLHEFDVILWPAEEAEALLRQPQPAGAHRRAVAIAVLPDSVPALDIVALRDLGFRGAIRQSASRDEIRFRIERATADCDSRRFGRSAVCFPVAIERSSGEQVRAIATSVSVGGMGIALADSLGLNAEVEVRFRALGDPCCVSGRVVYERPVTRHPVVNEVGMFFLEAHERALSELQLLASETRNALASLHPA